MLSPPVSSHSNEVWTSRSSRRVHRHLSEDAYRDFSRPYAHQLPERISSSESPLVAIIGVGYVGLELTKVFASKLRVLAFDISKHRINTLATRIAEFPLARLTSHPSDLKKATHFLVCVPTALSPDMTIDTSHIHSALNLIGEHARPGATVIIESSVAVGTTRKLLADLARTRQWNAGMSPERIDPGRKEPPLQSIPKIVSGLTHLALNAIHRLYSQVFEHVIPVSSPEVAEMTKLYENCQRMVCIAYANEMADACETHKIDPYEVSRAAETKPFGYLPVAPGLGVGGHCIPVNPYYLFSERDDGFPLLKTATERMEARPARLVAKAMKEYLVRRGPIPAMSGRPKTLVVGVAFKAGQSNLSHSPGVAAMKHLLQEWDTNMWFADPLVDQAAIPHVPKFDEMYWNVETLNSFDLVLVALRQQGLDFSVLDSLNQSVQVTWYCT